MWSFVQFNNHHRKTMCYPEGAGIINYVYFCDSLKWKDYFITSIGCGNYLAGENYKSIKLLVPNQHFQVHLLLIHQEELLLELEKHNKYIKVLNGMGILGKDIVDIGWLKDKRLLCEEDNFFVNVSAIEKYDGFLKEVIVQKKHNSPFVEMPKELMFNLKTYEMPFIPLFPVNNPVLPGLPD